MEAVYLVLVNRERARERERERTKIFAVCSVTQDIPAVYEQSVCEQFHIPFQSGDDEILRRMERGYTAERYRFVGSAEGAPRVVKTLQCCMIITCHYTAI